MSYFFQKLGSGTKGGEDESRRGVGRKKLEGERRERAKFNQTEK
jgi:hypothetical protein